MRAFVLSGKGVQYDGTDRKTGRKRFKTVTPLTKKMASKIAAIPMVTRGSSLIFELAPTITALSAFAAPSEQGMTLANPELLANLQRDFTRNLQDTYGTLSDLCKLSTLGALPLVFLPPSSIRVHFPGCDAETVERLCLDLGIERGVIVQDEGFDEQKSVEMALLFPFAPSNASSSPKSYNAAPRREGLYWADLLTPTPSPQGYSPLFDHSPYTDAGADFISPDNRGGSSPDIHQFSSVGSSVSEAGMFFQPLDEVAPIRPVATEEFEGVEGIYRFLEECERFER